MSDLLREIDEDVAKEKSEQFIEKWGLSIGISLVILVAGLFFYFNWQDRVETAALDEADAFAKALEDMSADPEASVGALTDLSQTRAGFGELSSFKMGDALWAADQPQEAVSAWQAYIANPQHNENLVNSARFRLAWYANGLLEPSEIIAEIEILEQVEAYAAYGPILRALVAVEADDQAAALELLALANAEDKPGPVRDLASALIGLAKSL